MTGMASIPSAVAETNLMVANVVQDVFSALFPSNSPPRGLETSRWASQGVVQQTRPNSQGLTDSIWAPKENNRKDPEEKPFTSHSSSSSPSRPRRLLPQAAVSSCSSSYYSYYSSSFRASSRVSPGKSANMHRLANVDDTVAFMAAARALNKNSENNGTSTVNDASHDQDSQFKTSTSPVGSPTAAEFVPSSASSSLAGNAAGSPGRVSPAIQDVSGGRNGSFVGSPTAPEFVPSSPSSLAGNPGGSQSSFSPAMNGINESQSPKSSSFVGNPAAEEFVPSSASSSAGNSLVEDFGPASTTKEEKVLVDLSFQKATGLDSLGSKPIATSSEKEKVTGNVDDTVGFMAAARALRHVDGISAANDSTSSPNVEEPSTPVDNSAGFMAAVQDIEQQDQPPAMSPVKDFFTPSSTKAEKASSGSDTVGLMSFQDSERTSQLLAPPSMKELTPTASSKKPGDVDDTVGFMAAARSLRRTPGMSLDADGTTGLMDTAQDAGQVQSNQFPRSSLVADLEEDQPGEADDMLTALDHTQVSRPSMSPVEHFVSAATSPEKKFRGDVNDSASSHTVTFSQPAPSLSLEASENPTTASNEVDDTAQQTTPRASGPVPEPSQEEIITTGVDDTSRFMTAVRALKNRQASSSTVPAVKTPVQEQISDDHGSRSNNDAPQDSRVLKDSSVVSPIPTANAPDAVPVKEENRENMTTFKTWGAPAPRAKPASQVRRIILTGLPSTWATPTKVLSLIHGGAIERVSVAPSGNAHVLFCEHEDCKAFYDKYPNGIGIGPYNVFVEMGQEVDVVSSQLILNRSVGSTRVVRAVGVDLGITMVELNQLASGSNRKVEKILDNYSPDEVRTVLFRFCSLDDAVRFRSMLVRNVEWEACNIQYGNDPCEMATGYHAD